MTYYYTPGGYYASLRIDQFLSSDGTADGSVDANVTPGVGFFYISPPSTGYSAIHRMLVTIRGSGTFTAAADYGDVAAPLTNGVEVGLYQSDGTLLQSFTANHPVKYNAGWAEHCYDADLKSWGAGNNLLLARWTFAAAGLPIILRSDLDIVFGVKVQDDLSALAEHLFKVQGIAYPLGAP